MNKDKHLIRVEVEKTLEFLDNDVDRIKTSPFFYHKLEARIMRQRQQRWHKLGSARFSAAAIPVLAIFVILINMASTAWVLNERRQHQINTNETYLTALADEYSPNYYSNYLTANALGE